MAMKRKRSVHVKRSLNCCRMQAMIKRYRRYLMVICTSSIVTILVMHQLQISLIQTKSSQKHRSITIEESLSKSNRKHNVNDGLNSGYAQNNFTYNNNNEDKSNLDSLDSIKKNLIIMRKYLENNTNNTASGPHHTPGSNQSDMFINSEQYLKKRIFFEENADTFVQIVNLLEQSGYVKDRDAGFQRIKTRIEENREEYRTNNSQQEDQILRIKELEPVYVDFNYKGAITDGSQSKHMKYLKDKLGKWELFHAKFPDDQSQDTLLRNFKLPEEIVQQLTRILTLYDAHFPKKRTRPARLKIYDDEETVSWKIFHQHINQYEIYNPDDPIFRQVIEEISTRPLIEAYNPSGGTQQKLLFYLDNNLRLIFKPMRFPRKQEALPDHMFWRDYERHFAEIASFHLDMVLGFHRVPPTIGRYVNVTSEIQALDVDKKLTFFKSPAGNKCFYGKCEYYCDTGHAVCGRPEIMEGSLMMYLPSSIYAPRVSWRHPWRRTYSKTTEKAPWEAAKNYCIGVKKTPPYNKGRMLLDLMDMAVFDFITGNMDRHHYETFEAFGNFSSPVLFDNGRGFGKSGHDELSILAPIYQCCQIRYSTLKKLLTFHKGPQKLSDAMRKSMSTDRANPVLLEAHLHALDRRVAMILKTIHKCTSSHSHTYVKVIIDDGF